METEFISITSKDDGRQVLVGTRHIAAVYPLDDGGSRLSLNMPGTAPYTITAGESVAMISRKLKVKATL